MAMGVAASLTLAAPSAYAASNDPEVPSNGEEYIQTTPADAQVGDYSSASSPRDMLSQAGASTRAPFQGYVQAHNPHISSGDASGHVSWHLTAGTSQKITLSSTLKARTSWFTFRTMAGPTPKLVWPGGGRGKDAVARYDCKNSSKRDWYTYGTGSLQATPSRSGPTRATSGRSVAMAACLEPDHSGLS